VGRLPSDGDFHLLGLDGEWHAAICPHFETSSDGFTNVHQGFLPRLSLADATGDGHSAIQTPSSSRSRAVRYFMNMFTLHFRF
jgi:hypothetical protein